MIVGMTYDLRDDYLAEGFTPEEAAEFDRRETIDGIRETLESLGYETDPIGHVRNLTRRIAAGKSWDLVFNIAEGLKGFAREAQVPALLEAHGIPYTFSDPMVLALTLHKGMTKRVIRDAGLATPDFRILEDLEDVGSVDLAYPLFAKPVAEGTGKGINAASKITNRDELALVCEMLLRVHDQHVIVETFLPGREFTVGILGNGKGAVAVGVMEVILGAKAEPEVYSFWNKEKFKELVSYRLVDDLEALQAKELALQAYRCLGCRDAARVDLRSDALGNPQFMEINPLPGLHPEHSDLPILCEMAGMSYRELIGRIMDSAFSRLRPSPALKRAVTAAGGKH
ncbi:MAG: D-alanine--D-alanine ligase family protein [Desulfatiglandales bacterium]